MYSTANVKTARQYCSEMGITMRGVSGPSMTPPGDSHLFVLFWALQVNVCDSSGVEHSGGHLGIQWANVGQTDFLGRINWGLYDDVIGGGAVCRGSKWPTAQGFRSDNSGDFNWSYGTDIKFRVARSSKQNWTAAELDNGSGQDVSHTNTNQQADETAYRMWMKVGTGPWFFARDCLAKNCPGVGYNPLATPVLFTEYLYYDSFYALTDFPYHPKCLFRDLVMDGRNCADTWTHTYPADHPTHNNITQPTVDSHGWIQHEGDLSVTRTTADGTSLSTPTSFHDAAPANVTPAITDNAARVATPRPWH